MSLDPVVQDGHHDVAPSHPHLKNKTKLDKDYANKEGTDIGTDGQMNEVQNHYSQRE